LGREGAVVVGMGCDIVKGIERVKQRHTATAARGCVESVPRGRAVCRERGKGVSGGG
jgi:hypothetical protein